jgi:hypothetical protein
VPETEKGRRSEKSAPEPLHWSRQQVRILSKVEEGQMRKSAFWDCSVLACLHGEKTLSQVREV